MINWAQVFDKDNPGSIFAREGQLFTAEEKDAADKWNACAVGQVMPKRGTKIAMQREKQPDAFTQAIEEIGLLFNDCVRDDVRHGAAKAYRAIVLLAKAEASHKAAVRRARNQH